MRINRQNLKWLGRMMLILLVVGVAEVLVVLLVPKPLPWVALIPTLIPLLTTLLIILPMARAEKPAPRASGSWRNSAPWKGAGLWA
jgi:hypothetical protein